MKEKGVLKEFMKTHKRDPAMKYSFNHKNDFAVVYEPMNMDVSTKKIKKNTQV